MSEDQINMEIAYGGTGRGVSRASATRRRWIVSWASVGTFDMIELSSGSYDTVI
jgi:hypothetical protein